MRLETNIYPYDPQLSELPFRLTGIGGSNYQGHITRPDGYMWHQILFCTKGTGILKINGQVIELLPNSIIVLPCKTPHEYFPTSNIWNVLWITFDGGYCDDTLNLLGLNTPCVVHTDNPGEIERYFEKMMVAQTTDILYSGYTCSGIVYNMLLTIRRLNNTAEDRAQSKRLSQLLPAVNYMHANYGEDIPMTYLASMLNITPQHFCRIFRLTYNMRPVDYLVKLRINEAIKLLDNHIPVSEVARRCGFNDAGYFSTVFKRYTGVSPTSHH